MSRETERVGRSGEFLTASVLSRVSDTVLIVPHGSHADVVFELENKLYKCQVKTKTKIENNRTGWRYDIRRGSHTKNRRYEDNSIDICAFVSLKYNTIYFHPFDCDKSQITISDENMKNVNAIDSFWDAVDGLSCQASVKYDQIKKN